MIREDYKENEGTVVKPGFGYCGGEEGVLRLKVEDGDEYVPNKMSVSKAPVGRAVWWMMASRMGIDVRVWIGLMRSV